MTARLPNSTSELRGRRAARWIRESTAGQFDRYGPDVQREQQDRAIARLGLVDTGLSWAASQSGSTVHAGPAMAGMLEAARGGLFDVLVVARSDRWLPGIPTRITMVVPRRRLVSVVARSA